MSFELPFTLDSGARKPLSQQVADGFRSAIKEGFYRDGDRLPTLRNLARFWKVSVKVPGSAYARLADEGYVVLHPGRGAVARRSGVRSWNGSVLFVSVGGEGGYFLPHFIHALRTNLEEANMRFYTAVVPALPDGKSSDFSYRSFAAYLNQSYDLVILLTDNPRLRTMVRRRTSMSLIVGRSTHGAVGPDVVFSTDAAEREFVADCLGSGVSSVQVLALAGPRWPVTEKLRAAGVRVDLVRIPPAPGLLLGEGYQRAAHDFWTDARIRDAKRHSLVYFADDNLALGSMIAFAERGIRVPEDVCVVTLCNRGSSLPFACDLARIEVDPSRIGRETALRALASLQAKKPSGLHVCPAVYRRGSSFPVAR